MTLLVNATIQAAESYVRNVRYALEFLVQQDAATANAPYAALYARLREARDLLRWNPTSGGPARFLLAQSGWGRAMAARAKVLAAAHGVPELPELVVKPYVLLFAHSAERVVLLALKHERQLIFQLA